MWTGNRNVTPRTGFLPQFPQGALGRSAPDEQGWCSKCQSRSVQTPASPGVIPHHDKPFGGCCVTVPSLFNLAPGPLCCRCQHEVVPTVGSCHVHSRASPVCSASLSPSRCVYLESNVIPDQSPQTPSGSTFHHLRDKVPRRAREHPREGAPGASFIPPHLPSRARLTAQRFGVTVFTALPMRH